jgi:hypothetical protein
MILWLESAAYIASFPRFHSVTVKVACKSALSDDVFLIPVELGQIQQRHMTAAAQGRRTRMVHMNETTVVPTITLDPSPAMSFATSGISYKVNGRVRDGMCVIDAEIT